MEDLTVLGAYSHYVRRGYMEIPEEVRAGFTPEQRDWVLKSLDWVADEVASDMY